MHKIAPAAELAFLAVVDAGGPADWTSEDQTAELASLAATAGARVVGTATQRRDRPDPRAYIGKGKALELASMSRAAGADLIVFSKELSPSQQRNLEELTGARVLDRTALILDIFAQHAHTREGKLQVELAQHRYRLPRLMGAGTSLSRLGGGIGTRGPGEQQLEVDRRRIRRRIQVLSKDLSTVAKERGTQRKLRSSGGVFNVCLVGYTNAGKSSLLNRLTDAGVLVQDKLFATLDSTSRKLALQGRQHVVLSDTVGFIQDLPHDLIAAFRSTLDEVRFADVLLHVVDIGRDEFERQMSAVVDVLDEIGAAAKPRIDVFNKADLLDDAELQIHLARRPDALAVSAVTGRGETELLEAIGRAASAGMEKATFLIPYDQGRIVKELHERGSVVSEKYVADGTLLSVKLRRADAGPLERYRTHIQG